MTMRFVVDVPCPHCGEAVEISGEREVGPTRYAGQMLWDTPTHRCEEETDYCWHSRMGERASALAAENVGRWVPVRRLSVVSRVGPAGLEAEGERMQQVQQELKR